MIGFELVAEINCFSDGAESSEKGSGSEDRSLSASNQSRTVSVPVSIMPSKRLLGAAVKGLVLLIVNQPVATSIDGPYRIQISFRSRPSD